MIDIDHGTIASSPRPPHMIRKDTNTIVIRLEQDEVLTVIAELAYAADVSWRSESGRVYLLIEQDEITHPRPR